MISAKAVCAHQYVQLHIRSEQQVAVFDFQKKKLASGRHVFCQNYIQLKHFFSKRFFCQFHILSLQPAWFVTRLPFILIWSAFTCLVSGIAF